MKYKVGDIIQVIKIYSYDDETKEDKEDLMKLHGGRVGVIEGTDKYPNTRCYLYHVRFTNGQNSDTTPTDNLDYFYARELRFLTEKEQFLYHILGSNALKEEI